MLIAESLEKIDDKEENKIPYHKFTSQGKTQWRFPCIIYILFFLFAYIYRYQNYDQYYNAVLEIAFLLQSLCVIKYLKNIQFKWMNNTNMDKLNI